MCVRVSVRLTKPSVAVSSPRASSLQRRGEEGNDFILLWPTYVAGMDPNFEAVGKFARSGAGWRIRGVIVSSLLLFPGTFHLSRSALVQGILRHAHETGQDLLVNMRVGRRESTHVDPEVTFVSA